MITLSFTALGTKWQISIDQKVDQTSKLQNQLEQTANTFEQSYSRFINTSHIARLNSSSADSTPISQELSQMLHLGKQLENTTDGNFSLNINALLTAHGYDADYSFQSNQTAIQNIQPGSYQIKDDTLTKNGSVQLDLGSLGKGYLIDTLTRLLQSENLHHFLIDGGGDVYCTTKNASKKTWRIALAYPGKPDQAIGTLDLTNQGFAASGSDQRRFKDFHHLLNPHTKQPVQDLLSVFTTASDGMTADACATAIFVSPKKYWQKISNTFKVEYLIIYPNFTYNKSSNFTGTLFK